MTRDTGGEDSVRLSAGEAAAAMAGKIRPPAPAGPREITGVSIDSRSVSAGDLFFAIRGPNRDGHAFVTDALERGAAGAVVAGGAGTPVSAAPGAFLIEVDDPTTALGALARRRRLDSRAEIAAITGSVGKTTAKEAAAAAIGATRRVFRSPGNLNNQWGLPLSLLAAAGDEEAGVVELGMSAPGEIRTLTEIAVPDAAVVTAVAEAHLENFASIEEIAAAKGEIYEALPEGATAVVNADDPLAAREARRFAGKRVSFGFSDGAEVRASDFRAEADGGIAFRVRAFGGAPETVRCGLSGRHNALNVLAGLTLALVLSVPLPAAAAGVRPLSPLPGRGERRPLPSGAVALDETYNSSPAALRALIATLAETPAGAGSGRIPRRILVAGDMRELGDRAEALHAECGRLAAEAGLDRIIGVGPLGARLAEAARAAGAKSAAAAEGPEEAAALLEGRLGPGDLAAFKASRAVGLERAIARLAGDAPGEPGEAAADRS